MIDDFIRSPAGAPGGHAAATPFDIDRGATPTGGRYATAAVHRSSALHNVGEERR